MELASLDGMIIGVVGDFDNEKITKELVKDIIVKKQNDSLKMVGLDESYLDKKFAELSSRDKNKIILASKLHDKEIVLFDFSKGLTKKDIVFFQKLFKKIVMYDRKVILVDRNSELFFNCVDKLYVINKENVLYETDDLFDLELSKYMDVPKIVKFINYSLEKGIKINHYLELDELLKAIYRIKS